MVDVTVNGNAAKALADTGSSQTLIKSNLLCNVLIIFDQSVNITCVHGCKKDNRTTDVIIEVEGQAFMLTVGVLDNLAYDVILGEDLPILDNLVQENSVAYSCAVVTCSVTKGLEPLPDADGSLYEGRSKVKKTKRQHHQEKNKNHVKAKCSEPVLPVTPLIEPQWQIPKKFRESQENDSSLKPLFAKVCEREEVQVSGSGGLKRVIGDPFIIKDNLLYLADIEKHRLVLPRVSALNPAFGSYCSMGRASRTG